MSGSPGNNDPGATGNANFLGQLTRANLARMRRAVRSVHKANTGMDLTDRECDRIIEAWGEQGCEAPLEQAIAAGVVSAGKRYFYGRKVSA